ncbi:MAG: hypothetical protein ACFB6R_03540 [Alphaproteobacteria bacterium]
MGWKIEAVAVEHFEGDDAAPVYTFKVTYDGTIPRTTTKMGVTLSIDDMMTDGADNMHFEGGGKTKAFMLPVGGPLEFTFSITGNPDHTHEGDEIFGVEITRETWIGQDASGTGYANTYPVSGQKAFGLVMNDDPEAEGDAGTAWQSALQQGQVDGQISEEDVEKIKEQEDLPDEAPEDGEPENGGEGGAEDGPKESILDEHDAWPPIFGDRSKPLEDEPEELRDEDTQDQRVGSNPEDPTEDYAMGDEDMVDFEAYGGGDMPVSEEMPLEHHEEEVAYHADGEPYYPDEPHHCAEIMTEPCCDMPQDEALF